MSLLEAIPGLRDATEKERLVRDVAFLQVNESIAGFEVKPMTFRQYLILRMMKSPVMLGVTPSPVELVAFLWLLSAHYTPGWSWQRMKFNRQCRAFIPKPAPWLKTKRAMKRWQKQSEAALIKAATVLSAARDYVDEAFMDRPGSKPGESGTDYFSDATSICATFAREFGWDDDTTLEKPIKRLLQYFKEIRRHHNPRAILFNPSDRITAEWLERENAKVKASDN